MEHKSTNMYGDGRNSEHMDILLIGNGFDLAHGIHTAYKDFLEFYERFMGCYIRRDEIRRNDGGIRYRDRPDYECIDIMIFGIPSIGEYFYKNTKDNVWINYFIRVQEKIKDRWIDFEGEIEKVIREIDNDIENDIMDEVFNSIHSGISDGMDYKLSILQQDFKSLCDALEIYLGFFVQNFDWKDTAGHMGKKDRRPFRYLKVDKILSFNYTNTYSKQYDPIMMKDYSFVHGKVRNVTDTATMNMSDKGILLGIPDSNESYHFLKDETKYYLFQKFFLRKKYGDMRYLDWIEEINESREKSKEKSRLFVIGYSFPYSDKEICEVFLKNANISIYVYYYKSFEQIQENIIRMIGKEKYKSLKSRIEYRNINDIEYKASLELDKDGFISSLRVLTERIDLLRSFTENALSAIKERKRVLISVDGETSIFLKDVVFDGRYISFIAENQQGKSIDTSKYSNIQNSNSVQSERTQEYYFFNPKDNDYEVVIFGSYYFR